MSNNQSAPGKQNQKKDNEQEQTAQPNSTVVTKESYGENFQEHLLEQYKTYVEMMDRVSARRGQTNSFYISLLSGLLAFISLAYNKDISAFSNPHFQKLSILLVAILGIILCLVWYNNIQSFKQLNSGKFKVIFEMEKLMPFPCYEREWKFLKPDKKSPVYLQQTQIEKYLPFILALPYLGLLIYSLFNLFE